MISVYVCIQHTLLFQCEIGFKRVPSSAALLHAIERKKISGITATESRIAHIEAGNHEIVFSVVYEPTTTFLGSLTVDIFIKAFEQLSVVPSFSRLLFFFLLPLQSGRMHFFLDFFLLFLFSISNICSHLSFCGVQTTFDR